MSESNGFEGPTAGDVTRQQVLHEVETIGTTMKRHIIALGGLITLLAAIVAVVFYLAGLAKAADVSAVREVDHKEFVQHVTESNGRVTAIETVVPLLHDDMRYMREQVKEIAKSTGARQVPQPVHQENP